ncbi:MAG: hypothetical protein WBV37_08755, partial [Nocardioidaceae bacterium]
MPSPARAEVQARFWKAVRPDLGETTQHVAGVDLLAGTHLWENRLVRRPERAVAYGHDATTADEPREGHGAVVDCEHCLADPAGEVDAAVPGAPRV